MNGQKLPNIVFGTLLSIITTVSVSTYMKVQKLAENDVERRENVAEVFRRIERLEADYDPFHRHQGRIDAEMDHLTDRIQRLEDNFGGE